MGIFSAVKYLIILVIVVAIGGGLYYIVNLKAALAVSELNNAQLEKAIVEQQEVIERTKQDIAQIQNINKSLQETVAKQEQDVKNLSNKFNKGDRDFGAFAATKPAVTEKLINRGTSNVIRCLELASGAPLNEKEQQAKSPTEANRECPSLIDPNYKSVTP
jgi:hypothetical protein